MEGVVSVLFWVVGGAGSAGIDGFWCGDAWLLHPRRLVRLASLLHRWLTQQWIGVKFGHKRLVEGLHGHMVELEGILKPDLSHKRRDERWHALEIRAYPTVSAHTSRQSTADILHDYGSSRVWDAALPTSDALGDYSQQFLNHYIYLTSRHAT